MEPIQPNQGMIRDITRIGIKASLLLRGVMLQKVNEETLKWGLAELKSDELMTRYFPVLATRPDDVCLLNILFLIYSLAGQLDFQLREYGLDSLKDDLHEINASLNQIGERFQLRELARAN